MKIAAHFYQEVILLNHLSKELKILLLLAEKYLTNCQVLLRSLKITWLVGFYSLSTPVWINFGKQKGLPISCYGSNVDDTLDSILNAGREIGMMSKYGGGTSVFLGNIRPTRCQ